MQPPRRSGERDQRHATIFKQQAGHFARMRDVWQVGRRNLAETPSRRLTRRFGMAIENGVWPLRTANVRARQLLGRRVLTVYRLCEMSERCRLQARQYPAPVRLIGNAPDLRHDFFPRRRCEPRHEPALTLALHQRFHWRTPIGWYDVEHALAVLRHEGVQIDDMSDQIRHSIGNTGDDHPAGAVTDQGDISQTLVLQEIDDVLDVGVEADFRASEMRAFAKAGERGGIDIVTPPTQQRGYLLPTPATKPSRMDQHERRLVAGPRHGTAPLWLLAPCVQVRQSLRPGPSTSTPRLISAASQDVAFACYPSIAQHSLPVESSQPRRRSSTSWRSYVRSRLPSAST